MSIRTKAMAFPLACLLLAAPMGSALSISVPDASVAYPSEYGQARITRIEETKTDAARTLTITMRIPDGYFEEIDASGESVADDFLLIDADDLFLPDPCAREPLSDGNTLLTLHFALPDDCETAECLLFWNGQGRALTGVIPDPEPDTENTVRAFENGEGELGADADFFTAVSLALRSFADPSLDAVWSSLEAGGHIASGDRGEPATGLQTLLVSLGRDIVIDGAAGKKTFAAFREVAESLHLPDTDSIDAPSFARMLLCLWSVREPEAAESALAGTVYTEPAFAYLHACGQALTGQAYAAYEQFSGIDWADASERAEAYALPWPKTGVVYRNEAYPETDARFCVVVEEHPFDQASLFKVERMDGELVACLFIGGVGQASVDLPGGAYRIRMGVGERWFGLADTFGKSGKYELLLFEDGQRAVMLNSGYENKLVIVTATRNQNTEDVLSEPIDWTAY